VLNAKGYLKVRRRRLGVTGLRMVSCLVTVMVAAGCTSAAAHHAAPGSGSSESASGPAGPGAATVNGSSQAPAGTGKPATGVPASGGPAGTSSAGASVTHLPLTLSTANATQVITVVAGSTSATTAMLQAWQRNPKGGWSPYGPKVLAHVGLSGMTAHERESLTATPMGSFTLTQAFGRLPNPGTRLPYFQTTPNDWWISQPGPLYNTHQVCITRCPFTTGSPNARLFYVSPQYNLAVAIDYNRFPVVQGAGSGVFLHVTRGVPTAGCVSIDAPDLVTIMRWLQPADHPRILIGVSSA
jgi:L,D-peptidoglycan transpeptidase YkuD (ErfK/YbiS/YcfS/YnhG family)